MNFLKAYIFEKDYKHWDDEIAFAVSDFYKQFSLFPNTLYAHSDTFNCIQKAVCLNRKMRERVEQRTEDIDSEEYGTLAKDRCVYISVFVGQFYELFFRYSEVLPPRFFFLEFSVSIENSTNKFDDDQDDDNDDWDNDFFPVLPRPKPVLAETISK
ncbi:MAG: hypothetical protein HND27_01290 [Bacteroidetes bacterium]|nr:hypothetical protein [Bacteroidota bacterium]MBV6461354.1 hypothetical protein [Flavobacteriales bacterium]WKZ75244.1 MAG: hypothetical protein QY303_13975 [Vicingaceae bacterium]MCL4816512.1 hypothetical protein [Flavobacteriales bacterium]NOG94392.1 hypothetical protein [Bacteroidota bacterium]